TKPKETRDGLGLSSVEGIVKQSGGHVSLSSEPGRGTTVRIYLPEAPGLPADRPSGRTRRLLTSCTETVLAVDDEEMIRVLAGEVLRSHGYTVLEAKSGEAALSVLAGHPSVDLLLTDLVMPGMSGRQLWEKVVARDPRMRVLFASGFTDDAVA